MTNNEVNKISSLSEKDKAAFLICSKCKYLREIDYEKLKVYCLKPKCPKQGEFNG